MSKRQFLILIGIWIMLFLFLGFPSAWDKIFALVTGLAIILIAFKQKPVVSAVSSRDVPYVEHKNGSVSAAPATSRMSDMNRVPANITSTDPSITP